MNSAGLVAPACGKGKPGNPGMTTLAILTKLDDNPGIAIQ